MILYLTDLHLAQRVFWCHKHHTPGFLSSVLISGKLPRPSKCAFTYDAQFNQYTGIKVRLPEQVPWFFFFHLAICHFSLLCSYSIFCLLVAHLTYFLTPSQLLIINSWSTVFFSCFSPQTAAARSTEWQLLLILLCLCGINYSSYTQACQRGLRHVWTHQTKPKTLWQTDSLHTPTVVTHTSAFSILLISVLDIYACRVITESWRELEEGLLT